MVVVGGVKKKKIIKMNDRFLCWEKNSGERKEGESPNLFMKYHDQVTAISFVALPSLHVFATFLKARRFCFARFFLHHSTTPLSQHIHNGTLGRQAQTNKPRQARLPHRSLSSSQEAGTVPLHLLLLFVHAVSFLNTCCHQFSTHNKTYRSRYFVLVVCFGRLPSYACLWTSRSGKEDSCRRYPQGTLWTWR